MRGLTWRDLLTTVLIAVGGVVLWARLHDYSWWLVNTWRGAILVMGILAVAAWLAEGMDMANRSILNRFEMWLGWLSALVLLLGLIFGVEFWGVTFAIMAAVLWLTSTARDARRSYMHSTRYMNHHPGMHAAA